MATLYDLLGVAPEATSNQVRHAYRQRVRDLHPDRNPHARDGDIRELNAAWAVLGNPQRRREYDRTLARPAPSRMVRTGPVAAPEPPLPRWTWLLRPSGLAVALLLTIVVVTAYANSHPVEPAPPTTTTSTSLDPSRDAWLINQCMLSSGIVAPCANPDTKQVRAVLPKGADCPALTYAFAIAGDVEVCLSGRP